MSLWQAVKWWWYSRRSRRNQCMTRRAIGGDFIVLPPDSTVDRIIHKKPGSEGINHPFDQYETVGVRFKPKEGT